MLARQADKQIFSRKSSKIGHFSLILADFWRFLAFFCDFFDFSTIFGLFSVLRQLSRRPGMFLVLAAGFHLRYFTGFLTQEEAWTSAGTTTRGKIIR